MLLYHLVLRKFLLHHLLLFLYLLLLLEFFRLLKDGGRVEDLAWFGFVDVALHNLGKLALEATCNGNALGWVLMLKGFHVVGVLHLVGNAKVPHVLTG